MTKVLIESEMSLTQESDHDEVNHRCEWENDTDTVMSEEKENTLEDNPLRPT